MALTRSQMITWLAGNVRVEDLDAFMRKNGIGTVDSPLSALSDANLRAMYDHFHR